MIFRDLFEYFSIMNSFGSDPKFCLSEESNLMNIPFSTSSEQLDRLKVAWTKKQEQKKEANKQ